jgi:hypothetical protein
MELKAQVCGKALFFSHFVMMIDLGQSFDHIPAFLRETGDEIHEVAPGMGETVGQKRLKLFGHIAAQGVAHLDRGAKTRGPLFQEFSHILPRVLGAGKE